MNEKLVEQIVKQSLESARGSNAGGIYELAMVLGGIAILVCGVIYVILKLIGPKENKEDKQITHLQIFEKLGHIEQAVNDHADQIKENRLESIAQVKELKVDMTLRFESLDKDMREVRAALVK